MTAATYLAHPLHGLGYQFFSGIGSSISEWVVLLVALGTYAYHHNCHEHRCLRLSWHPDRDGHPVCKVHSKDHPARGWLRWDRGHPRHAVNRTGQIPRARNLTGSTRRFRMTVSNVKVSPTGITFHHTGTSQIVVATRHPKKEGAWVPFGLLADAKEGDLSISGAISPGDGIAIGDGNIAAIQYAELPAVTPPPPEEKPAPEEKPQPTSELVVGWNGGGWGTADITDAKLGKHTGVRLENPSSISNYTAAGLKALWLANHYSTGGVQSISRSEFLSRVKTAYTAAAWRIEIENEPGGNWFWGSNAEAAAAFKAYAELLHESHAAAPNAKLLASWDGGHAGGGHFGKEVLKTDPTLHNQPWLDWSVHCYAGSGANPTVASINPPSGLCGHLPTIDQCHAETGCNVIVSELGFPTIEGTGDSPHCTEEQQKHGHEACLAYCRARPYVEGYFAYGYRDGSGAKGYGLVRSDDSKKPAFYVVHP